jgi:hypothetical protein
MLTNSKLILFIIYEGGSSEFTRQQCTKNVTRKRVRLTTVAVEKQQIFKIMSMGILVLFVRHAKRMRPIILPSVYCMALPSFLYRFSKNIQISDLMEILLVGAELFREDKRTTRQADMTKLTVRE